jgi:RNA polymerase sigma-54 factor
VIPDIKVVHKDGIFTITLNNEEIPVLGIEPFFLDKARLKGDKTIKIEEKDYIRENLAEAKWFIDSINKRNHTLLRVTRAIVHFQKDFFVYGPKHLVPLRLYDIANQLKLNNSTVSRAANGKYMQTEWGIFELRHFFTLSINSKLETESSFTKNGVKEYIEEIIDQNSGAAITDQAIADILLSHGIKIARRTVSKYRKELALGSSYER